MLWWQWMVLGAILLRAVFVVPANLADLTSMMALATDIAKGKSGGSSTPLA